MASIVVSGDTSGTVTLSAPSVAGTTTLTLPTTSGTLITTGGGAAGSFTTLTSTQDASFATSSGNVGIGTTSPSTKLHVVGSVGAFNLSNSDTISNQLYMQNTAGNKAVNFQIGSTGILQTWVYGGSSWVNATTIDSSGNVGIGTASPNTRLIVQASTGTAVQRILNTVGVNTYQMSFNNSVGEVGTISTGSGTTAYNTSSDYRLKENVTAITNALDKVSQLKPVNWTWKVDGSDGQGFIAHELQEVVPQAVTGEKDAVDTEGKPIYQGVDTSFLVATLTAAIQELTARVKELEAKVK